MQSFASTVVVSGQHIFYCSIRLVGPHSDGRFPSPLVGLHAEPTGHNSFPFGSGGGGSTISERLRTAVWTLVTDMAARSRLSLPENY